MARTKITSRCVELSAGVASLALCVALGATPAFAQVTGTQTDPAVSITPGGDAKGEAPDSNGDIVVTGSRIARRADLTGAAPLTVVSQEEFKQSGAVNVESVLNLLPSVVPGTTAFSNNPGGGVATLGLRDLGAARTLVLVNGRRYMFYDTGQIVDLNTIPAFLLSGVDVETGGASAVYGSDAIAGVVNFRLRTDLNGFEAGITNSITGKGDGARFDAHVAMGGDFADGKGHVTMYGEYYKRNPIFQADRSYSNVTLSDNATATGFVPGGSASTPSGRFYTTSAFGAGTNFLNPGATFNAPGGASRPYSSATDSYNYAPSNYLMVPQERWLIGAYGEYDADDHFKPYMEVSFVNNRVDSALAATPFSGNYLFNLAAIANKGYLTAADYATLQAISAKQVAAGYTFTGANGTRYTVGAGQVGLTFARRSIEVGLRQNHDDRNAYRALLGTKGDIADGFTYDLYYSYARTKNSNYQSGNLSISKIQSELLNGSLDLFGPGSITPTEATAISILAQNQDISTLQVANASVQGKLFNFGLGGEDVALAFGGEWRSVASQFIPDTALSSGDVVGFNAAKATAGHYDVKEAFGELDIPIIADRPFFHSFEVHGAGRYSSYSLGAVGNVGTYAGGATWSPIKDITLRGQYNRAVRAPNVGELYSGAGQDFATATDPCAAASAASNAALKALCIATGVPAAAVGSGALLQPNTQIQAITAGNPNLKAEKSDSYTFGAVLQPSFLPRFHFSADYFHINVKDAITTVGASTVLNLCYNTANVNAAACALIARNPTTGQIDGSTGANGTQYVITEAGLNVGYRLVSGIDFAGDYTIPLHFGFDKNNGGSRINLYALATYSDKNDVQIIAGDPTTLYHCAGRFGSLACGNPAPHWKTDARVTYTEGPVSISGKWDYIGPVYDDNDAVVYTTETIHGYSLYSLSASFNLTEKYGMTVGVNNLLDKTPPIVGTQQQQANGYPSVYDYLGRDFFVSVNLRF